MQTLKTFLNNIISIKYFNSLKHNNTLMLLAILMKTVKKLIYK